MVILVLLLMTTEAAGGGGGGGLGVKLLAAANVTIPAMFMFVDSIVDTGNNNDNLKTPARCNFPPYGRDFQGGIPTGRYSNGKVPSDFIASSNDLANTYFVTGIRKLEYDVPSYTDLMLNHASDFLKGLYALGARRIGVFGAPPIGCLPSQRTLGGGMLRDCVEKPNQAAMLFNSKLSAELDDLNKNLPNSNLVYMLTSTTLYSISSSTLLITALKLRIKGVAGVGSWSYHPTEAAYKIIVKELMTKYIYRLA
ncbi:unnamed protein product [Prunus armeniaca]|uniref:GDSL esterase/lipase n=1 Tax=Prunus armeniaca TaxID=36596 RepID=A0A6J5WCR9_PRUAR|nr:unnamed protein product [Prunus armeniaca]